MKVKKYLLALIAPLVVTTAIVMVVRTSRPLSLLPPPVSKSQMLNTIYRNFDYLDTSMGVGMRDGSIGRCDIEAALKNKDVPLDLREACEYLVDNPALFNQISHGGGFLTREGIQEVLTVNPEAR